MSIIRSFDSSSWIMDNSPQGQLAPRQLAPRKTRPMTTRPTFRRQLAPFRRQIAPHSEDNSPQLFLTCYNLKINLNSFRRPVTLAYKRAYIQTYPQDYGQLAPKTTHPKKGRLMAVIKFELRRHSEKACL